MHCLKLLAETLASCIVTQRQWLKRLQWQSNRRAPRICRDQSEDNPRLSPTIYLLIGINKLRARAFPSSQPFIPSKNMYYTYLARRPALFGWIAIEAALATVVASQYMKPRSQLAALSNAYRTAAQPAH